MNGTNCAWVLGVFLFSTLVAMDTDADNHLATEAAAAPVVIQEDPLAKSKGSWGQPYPDQWGLYAIGRLQPGGRSMPLPSPLVPVTVALIDTGVDYGHPDLPAAKFWMNPREQMDGRDNDGNGLIDDLIGWNFVDGNNTPWDDHGHGTHIAGIIAAQSGNGVGVAGVAPNARLMVLKALDGSGHGSGSDIASAIRYAVSQGALIIQLSLGGEPPGPLERDAIAYAVRENRLVIVAVGNQAEAIGQQGYESLDNLLLVGAATPERNRATFSDWGSTLGLLAPGVDVLSLRARGSDFLRRSGEAAYPPGSAVVDKHYYRATGSSFAAPFVTGTATLLLGSIPQLQAADLKRTLLQSADDLGPPGPDMNHGYGLLNLAAALNSDPARYIEAYLSHIDWQPTQGMLLYGTADADQFLAAQLAFGTGSNPEEWKPLSTLSDPIQNGALMTLDPEYLPADTLLTLRLTTEHRDGGRRQSFLQLEMPARDFETSPSDLEEEGGL